VGEATARTAAIQVDDAFVPVAGEEDALVEGVVTLEVKEARVPQQIEGIALRSEMTPQAPTGGITDLQFPDQSGVAHSPLFQILTCLWVAIELLLIEIPTGEE
jgi:hypothetical protein